MGKPKTKLVQASKVSTISSMKFPELKNCLAKTYGGFIKVNRCTGTGKKEYGSRYSYSHSYNTFSHIRILDFNTNTPKVECVFRVSVPKKHVKKFVAEIKNKPSHKFHRSYISAQPFNVDDLTVLGSEAVRVQLEGVFYHELDNSQVEQVEKEVQRVEEQKRKAQRKRREELKKEKEKEEAKAALKSLGSGYNKTARLAAALRVLKDEGLDVVVVEEKGKKK